jgi:Homeodomain-like domain
LERRRLQAADLFAQGKTRAEVAGELGVSAQTASRWSARWRDGGTVGMRTARQGKPAQLGPTELGKVRRLLDRGAVKAGFDNDLMLLICGGTPGQREFRVGSAASWLLAGYGGPKPWVKVERPQRARTNDLDAGEGCHRIVKRSSSLRHVMGITVRGLVCWQGPPRAGVQPYLGARTRSGDVMGDRVPARGGCGRSFYGGRPRPAWRQEHQGADRTTPADLWARAHDGRPGQAAVGSSAGTGTSAWSPSSCRVW